MLRTSVRGFRRAAADCIFPSVAVVVTIRSAVVEGGRIPMPLENVSPEDGDDRGIGLCLEEHDRFSFVCKSALKPCNFEV